MWAAGARAVGWGSSDAHARAKELAARRALAEAHRRRCARSCESRRLARRPESAPRYCSRAGARQARQAQVQVHARPGDPGGFRGRDCHPAAVHDGDAPTPPARSPRPPSRCPRSASRSGPIFKSTPHHWETIGTPDQFPDNNYVPVVITLVPGIGEAGKSTAYVRKHNPAIDTDMLRPHTPYIAISDRCAHLGCPVRWVAAAERFICPCHGGVYELLGRPASAARRCDRSTASTRACTAKTCSSARASA